jgi:hypothetical protein
MASVSQGPDLVVERLRTLKVTVSPLLGEMIVAVLLPHLPLDIVGLLETREGLTAALGTLSPDLLLLGLLVAEPETIAQSLLVLVPSMKVVALAADGRQAWLFETGLPPLTLPDLSVSDLVCAVVRRFSLPPPMG